MVEVKKQDFFYGTGRRKSAVARVRLQSGKGVIIINGQPVPPNSIIEAPLVSVGKTGNYDVSVVVDGGGMTSQIEAIRLGVARALVVSDSTFRQALRKAGFLTCDARVKERKKPGLRRARRAPQWAKR